MANTAKTFLDLTGLTTYDAAIKAWANTASQVAYKTVHTDADNNYIYFYKKPNAVLGTDTPDATISLGSGDLGDKLDALASVCGATWDAVDEVYTISLDNTFNPATTTVVAALNELKGQINTLNGADTVAGSVAKSIKDAVEALDVTEFALASDDGTGVVTIKGIREVDGAIAVGTNTANDITLAKVATTGTAADVAIVDAGGLITATDVEDALQELAQASAGGVASKTVYITETSGTSSDPFSKRYGVYQGATGSSSSPVAGEKLADIDIPKDMVVESGSVVDIVFVAADSSLHEGSASGPDVTADIVGPTGTATAADAGKYIKLVIANATSDTLYIAAQSLVDIYTVETNASEVQLAISNTNEISATIVNIDGAKIGYTYSSGSMTESVAAALTRLDGNDQTTGSVAKKIKDAIDALDTASDVDIATYAAGTSGAADVITLTSSVNETNGVIGAGADTITLSTITTAEINALFT